MKPIPTPDDLYEAWLESPSGLLGTRATLRFAYNILAPLIEEARAQLPEPRDLEREKFEVVARDKGYMLRRSTNGDYDMGDTRLAWDMWQAARKEQP